MPHISIRAALAAAVCLAAVPAMAGDFDGGYGGITGNAGVITTPSLDYEFGAFAGYNFASGSGFVAGGEADVAYNPDGLWGPDAMTAKANARAGYELTDNVLAYGKGGIGYTTGGAGSMVWSFGAGVDIEVLDGVLLRAEGERVDPTAAGMATQYNGKVGLGYEF